MTPTIISAIAAPIEQNGEPDGEYHQLKMQGGLYLSITPEVARQWLPVITEIAKDA